VPVESDGGGDGRLRALNEGGSGGLLSALTDELRRYLLDAPFDADDGEQLGKVGRVFDEVVEDARSGALDAGDERVGEIVPRELTRAGERNVQHRVDDVGGQQRVVTVRAAVHDEVESPVELDL